MALWSLNLKKNSVVLNKLIDKSLYFGDKPSAMNHFFQTTAALILIFSLAPSAWTQLPQSDAKTDRARVCHTMGNLDRLIHAHPKMEQRMASIEKQTNAYVKRMKNNPQERSQMVVTIPVVFHVLYNTDAENISEAQVLSQ